MTDQKRDEKFDIAINPDSMELAMWKNVQGDARFARYVPHDDLVAAEERLSEAVGLLSEICEANKVVGSPACDPAFSSSLYIMNARARLQVALIDAGNFVSRWQQ